MTSRRAPGRGSFSADFLLTRLRELVQPLRRAQLCLAYSGGADSTALLVALALLRKRAGYSLRALHIDHGLHPDSASWARQAVALAARWQVPCEVVPVQVARSGVSLEAAARAARYAAFAGELRAGEYLLTAHHAEDQLETLLLQLLRGAGLAGLAAMPASQSFAGGSLLRPLLPVARAALGEFVSQRQPDHVVDPSNSDERFDRNYLRSRVLPLLQSRWPAAARTAVRSAGHLGEAQALLDALAHEQWQLASDGAALRVTALRALPAAARRNLLRYWLQQQHLPLPDSAQLHSALVTLLQARDDAIPEAHWPGVRLRRYQGAISASSDAERPAPRAVLWHWRREATLRLPGSGQLTLLSDAAGAVRLDRLPRLLRVGFRAGGESLALPRGHKPLKQLLQEREVPPWQRVRVPLLYSGRRLLAVADHWLHPELRASAGVKRRAQLRFVAESGD